MLSNIYNISWGPSGRRRRGYKVPKIQIVNDEPVGDKKKMFSRTWDICLNSGVKPYEGSWAGSWMLGLQGTPWRLPWGI